MAESVAQSPASPSQPGQPKPYQLAHEPDGTSYTVRENLVDILRRELLGPAGGPEEVLPISPRQLYLVGHIAPVKLQDDRLDRRGPTMVRRWPTSGRMRRSATCPGFPPVRLRTRRSTPTMTRPRTRPRSGG